MRNPTNNPCPCGGNTYADCCGPFHHGRSATTAEALMRSRYSAYVLKLRTYLLDTWHPNTRPTTLDLEQDVTQWIGLVVKLHIVESPDDAVVEFVARYKINGRAHRLHETSRFARIGEAWHYVDGTLEE